MCSNSYDEGLAGPHEDPRTARAHAVPAAMEHQACRPPRSDNILSVSNEPAVSSRPGSNR